MPPRTWARPQDAATLITLFEVAGLPDTVEIEYDDTKQVNGATMASALANQRQQAQRFLGTIVA